MMNAVRGLPVRSFLAVLLVVAGLWAPDRVNAQTTIQPRVHLVFTADRAVMAERERRAADLAISAIEGKFRTVVRYQLSRVERSTTARGDLSGPGEPDSVVVVVGVDVRRDGGLAVDAEVRRDGDTVYQEAFELPVGDERFDVARDIADSIESAVAGGYAGFGRIRFDPQGAEAPYVVYADGVALGAGITEIELPVGTYMVEVRRPDGRFEHVVGSTRLTLESDDFVNIPFSLSRRPPPVPGYLRLTNPTERWRVIFDVRTEFLIPQTGFDDVSHQSTVGGWAATLFNDVAVNGLVLGVEAGHIHVEGKDSEEEQFTYDLTTLVGTAGLSAGPVAGVDFLVRGFGGYYESRATILESAGGELYSAFGGIAQFGFGLFGDVRLSVHTSWLGLYSDADLVASWVGVGAGLGARF